MSCMERKRCGFIIKTFAMIKVSTLSALVLQMLFFCNVDDVWIGLMTQTL